MINQANEQQRTVRIWSAVCSSGQEPYTLAMLIHEITPRLVDRVKITGTDISKSMARQFFKPINFGGVTYYQKS